MKNVVFLVNIQLGTRAKKAFQYSIDSWKNWCNKRGFETLILTESIHSENYMKPNWQKWYLFHLLEKNNIKYDQILIVDADTIVHPDCPNFFEETEGKFSVVRNDGCYEWVNRSIKGYSNLMFDKTLITPQRYFNTGFMVVNEKHKEFFKIVIEWYHNNVEMINEAQRTIQASTEQTPLNFLTRIHNIDLKFLPLTYNLQDLFRKNLLHIPNHSWWEDSLENLYSSGWVYHFNAIPQNERHVDYWMKRVYEELYK